MNLVTRVSLGQTLLKNLPVLLPDLKTQETVAAQLDAKCGSIETLVTKLNGEIALFTEYRTRLISDVVTGRLDVRNAAPTGHWMELFIVSESLLHKGCLAPSTCELRVFTHKSYTFVLTR